MDLDLHVMCRLSLVIFQYLWSSASFFHVIKKLLPFGTFYVIIVDLGPVPERRNNSIPGINVPNFRENFTPGINSVPEGRNSAI